MMNFFSSSKPTANTTTTVKDNVTLHPVNNRNNHQSNLTSSFSNLMSNPVTINNNNNITTTRQIPRAIKSTRPLPPTITSNRNNSFQQSQQQQQNQQTFSTKNLGIEIDSLKFPLLPSTTSTPIANNSNNNNYQIKLITATDFNSIYKKYLKIKLPLEELFPFLHTGTEIPGSNAGRYFGFGRNDYSKRPINYKGLTIITPTPSSSSLPLPSSHLLVSTLPLSNFLQPSSSSFKNVAPQSDKPVNLRGFGNQGSKYGRISDVIVYGPKGLGLGEGGLEEDCNKGEESLVRLAERVRDAMKEEDRRDGKEGKYNVYIVVDSFDVFEKYYPDLIAINSNGIVENKLDFSIREAEEMRVLTTATCIAKNVYLGNTQDVPDLPSPTSSSHSSYHSHSNSQSTQSFHSSHSQQQPCYTLAQQNPLGLSICVEGHENARMPSKEILLNYSNLLNKNEEELLFWKGLRKEEGNFSEKMGISADQVRMDRIDQKKQEEEEGEEEEDTPSQILHLETLPSSLSLPDDNQNTITNYLDSLLDQAFWLYDQANPSSTTPLFTTTTTSTSSSSSTSSAPSPHQYQQSKLKSQSKGRRILIHCRDGYTETSLLALVYLSVANRQGIAQSYLTLHNLNSNPSPIIEEGDGGRSFFVYEKDMKILKELEIMIEMRLKLRDETIWKINLEAALAGEESSVGMGRSDSGFVDGVSVPPLLLGGEGGEEGDETLTEELVEKWFESEWKLNESDRVFKKSNVRDHPWYFSVTWEGSFPSKILDGLYLGNLAQASNALMLKAIGITHVVSVGESALFPPSLPSSHRTSRPNSLYLESQSSTPSLTVLDLKNINDDGIDSIRPSLDEAIKFIDEAVEQGGKVFVHCRVGVSRSASVVIAYLMKYQEWDLASSYLLTRSRRLNILIQPNLPFVATLHALEAELIKEKEARDYELKKRGIDVFARPMGETGLRRSNRLTWSALCWELYVLNMRFLEW